MFKKIYLMILVLSAGLTVQANSDSKKLRTQLEEEVRNYDLSTQKIFDKACCDPTTKKLNYYIQEDYDQIQKEINSCLRLKHRVLDPQTLKERDFEEMAKSTNRDLYKIINSNELPREKKVEAYKKLQKYIKNQNEKRAQVKERYSNRRTCVGRNYQSLYNSLKMKLDSNGGTAYRELRKCLTGTGDLRYSCYGNEKHADLDDTVIKKQEEPVSATKQTYTVTETQQGETFQQPELTERQKRKYLINYKSEKKTKRDRTNN